MVGCENCGSEVAEGVRYCPNCGTRLGGTATPGHGQGTPGQAPSSDGPGAPEQSQRRGTDRQPQSQTPGGGDRGPPSQRQRSPGGGADDGLSRRTLLAAGGGVVAAAGAGAGWFVFLRGPGDPLQVLERLWSTWEGGNADAYQGLFHSDSPERQEQYWNDDQYWAEFGPREGVDWTIEDREVIDRTETRATVQEVYVWRPPDESTVRLTDRLDFRTESGEWRVWEITGQDVEELGGGS